MSGPPPIWAQRSSTERSWTMPGAMTTSISSGGVASNGTWSNSATRYTVGAAGDVGTGGVSVATTIVVSTVGASTASSTIVNPSNTLLPHPVADNTARVHAMVS